MAGYDTWFILSEISALWKMMIAELSLSMLTFFRAHTFIKFMNLLANWVVQNISMA